MNPIDQNKYQSYLEIIIQARNQIINSDKQLGKNRHTFKCNQLIKWIEENVKVKRQKDELVNDINMYLFNPEEHQQVIYILDKSISTFKNDAKLARFIQDEYKEYASDESILNINEDSLKQQKFFYESDYKNDAYMEDPSMLMTDIRITLQELKAQALSDDGSSIDYEKIGQSDIFNQRFQELIQKLPFINQQVAFFLNCYNILNIHSIIQWRKSKQSYNMSSSERSDFYNKYQYNIAGQNYSLNDIEHGILRKNDNFGNSKFKTFCLLLQGKSLSDKSKPRFYSYDPRSKLCVQSTDFRIHFCLNCGAKSCPPIRVYDPLKLDKQMELSAKSFIMDNVNVVEIVANKQYKVQLSMLFKWYKDDFANNDYNLFDLLSNYTSEINKEYLQNIIKNKLKYSIQYTNYDWTINNYIKQ